MRSPLTAGRLSGRRSRHAERKRLVAELDAACEDVRRAPWSQKVQRRLDDAVARLQAFDRGEG